MEGIAVVGLDLAKTLFQVHGVAANGSVIVRKQLRRGQVLAFFAGISPCLVGIEACASAHYWGRELASLGHEVRLMPPAYVKAYVKRGKTDAADAEAIAEAVTRPTMRFVAIMTKAQQAVLMLHKTRDLLGGGSPRAMSQSSGTGSSIEPYGAVTGRRLPLPEVWADRANMTVPTGHSHLAQLKSFISRRRKSERTKDVSLAAARISWRPVSSNQRPRTITPAGRSTAPICISGSPVNNTRLAR
jgi:Transposase